ncbi:MAG: DUF2254 family protein [Xanthobacteraceae bacterium]
MRLWLIPMIYVAASVVCGLALPRIEQAYLGSYTFNLSVTSAQACLSAAASGMMALTGVVFAMAFVMVQFSAIAYSPRLVLWFARDRVLFHSLGAFAATFIYALFTLAWIDRDASGTVPLLSTAMVAILLICSMLLFSRLVQRLTDLQITSVLQLVGDKGREVIRDMFRRLDGRPAAEWQVGIESAESARFGPVSQTLMYSGRPRTIAELNTDALVRQARQSGGVIVMACAVGDTLVDGSVVLRVHGAKGKLAEKDLMRAVHLAAERTFEQDPKYPIRLLVDIAIKALSPAINDPTTAVQAIDQIEDLLRRLVRRDLDAGFARDSGRRLAARRSHADMGRLSDARLRRNPPVRHELDPGDAAIEGGAHRSRRRDDDRGARRGGAAISPAPRSGYRAFAARFRGQGHGAARGPARARSLAPAARRSPRIDVGREHLSGRMLERVPTVFGQAVDSRGRASTAMSGTVPRGR